MIKFIKKVILGIIIIILITELVFRLLYSDKLVKWTQSPYHSDPLIGSRYKPNSEGFKTRPVFKNKYKINGQGFNWDEFSLKKDKDILEL